jgi:competence protein ComEC
MKSSLAKIRFLALSYIFLILLFFIECTIAPAPATPETKVEPTVTSTTDKLKVHFIKTAEMCDAIFIDLGESEILIDGGWPDSGVSEYIKDYVDGSLEAVVATHPHPDHIGGLVEVLEAYHVKEIWVNREDLKLRPGMYSMSAKKPMSQANKEEASVRVARRGQTVDIGILSFYVVHPDSISQAVDNNNSIVLRLRYGNIAFLFTGDALKRAEANILEAGLEGHIESGASWLNACIFSSIPKVRHAKGCRIYGSRDKKPDIRSGKTTSRYYCCP